MTVSFTNADVTRGHLKINTGTEDYSANITVPVIVDVSKSEKGNGVINLGNGDDVVNYSGTGNATINLGAGDDTFIQQNPSQPFVNITGGLGNDTYQLLGAHMNFNYTFVTGVTSNEGSDVIEGVGSRGGFFPGYDFLTLHTAGAVNPSNFSTYFAVTDTAQGDVITTVNTSDNFSVTLVGVHLSAQQLIDQGAFHFA